MAKNSKKKINKTFEFKAKTGSKMAKKNKTILSQNWSFGAKNWPNKARLSMVTWFNQQIVTDLLLFTSNIALFSHRHDVTQSYDDFLGSFTGKNGRKINQNRTFGSFLRYEKGEKWPKMGHF